MFRNLKVDMILIICGLFISLFFGIFSGYVGIILAIFYAIVVNRDVAYDIYFRQKLDRNCEPVKKPQRLEIKRGK